MLDVSSQIRYFLRLWINYDIYSKTQDDDSLYLGELKRVDNGIYIFEKDEKEIRLTFKQAINPVFAYS